MKQQYPTPDMEVILFATEDVVTTSEFADADKEPDKNEVELPYDKFGE